MKINMTCFASLSQKYDCDYDQATPMELERGSTVRTLMEASGVSDKDVKIAFVNGKSAEPEKTLNDGDWVALMPATGGM
jgi:molybdopterin converting factor small subunit